MARLDYSHFSGFLHTSKTARQHTRKEIPVEKSPYAWMKSRAGACLLALPLLMPASPWARPQSGSGCLVAPAEVDFGPTSVGDTAIREATLRNACRNPLDVTSLAVSPNAFGASPSAPIRIAGLGSASVSLRFMPADTGAAQGRLAIRASDSRSQRSVVLKGSGAAASVRSGDLEVSPARIDESLRQGHSVGKTITIRNHGQDSLPIAVETWVEAPGTGRDSAGRKASILFLSTLLDDDIENNFIWLLQGVPKVSGVTIRSGRTRTPGLAELLPYDLVVVSAYYNWADPDSVGNLLADYADRGGTVVLMHRSLDTAGGNGEALGGRIIGPEYSPVSRGGFLEDRYIYTNNFIDHPLTQSVDWFETFTAQNAPLQGKGRPLGYMGAWNQSIAAAYNPDRPVYFINVVPYEPEYHGHKGLAQLFLNIIDRMQGTYNWLKNPVSNASEVFTLAPGETRQIILPVGHSYPLPAGTHYGTLNIWSKYPQFVRIPATLKVTVP
jgi:centrosomal CEP192-like protein